MNRLTDFFQPINFLNVVYFFSIVIFFDIFGSFIKRFFVKDKRVLLETRLTSWLVGLGSFIFIWFTLGFFVIPSRNNILISVGLLALISTPNYIKSREHIPLLSSLKQLILPFFLLIPFLPAVFVKASLPPDAWDEMAYHFISPYTMLHHIDSYWVYNGGLYQNVPRLIDTLYILSFSLTHTYSVVRLVQFSILVTSFFLIYLFVKKLLGRLPAFLFALIYLSLPLQLPYISTVGYVDVPAFSFLLLGFVLGMDFLFSKSKDLLILSMIFFAMSVGTKYTTLIAFVTFTMALTAGYWIKNRSLTGFLDRKTCLKIALGITIFGGYWYIKNFVMYGNPIYPFIFPCWGKYSGDCVAGSSFFGTWTTPIYFRTLYPIIKELLPQNIFLRVMLFMCPFVVVFFGNKRIKLILLLLIVPLVTEFLVMKYFSGFLLRYQQHLELILVIIIILPFAMKFRTLFLRRVGSVALLALVGSCLVLFLYNLVSTYNLNNLPIKEKQYAIGKLDIFSWIRKEFTGVSEAVIWCGNTLEIPVALARFDPDMIWYDANGLMRAYLVGCYYSNPKLSPNEWDNILIVAKERKLKFWTITINPCIPEKEVKLKTELIDESLDEKGKDEMLQMRRLNNAIVCNSREVLPNLYYFNYEKFN